MIHIVVKTVLSYGFQVQKKLAQLTEGERAPLNSIRLFL